MNARNTRKLPPQFTNVNEEGVCRSMTKQSPAILYFEKCTERREFCAKQESGPAVCLRK